MLKTILYTREHSCPEVIKQQFFKKEMLIKEIPLITTVPVEWQLEEESFDWVFFTSANTVKFLDNRFDLTKYKIASIGNKTTEALLKRGLQVDFQPTHAVAECLSQEWLELNQGKKGQTIFLPNSVLARNIIPEELEKQHHYVIEKHIYQTIFPEQSRKALKLVFQENRIKDVMVSSPSIWHHFYEVAKAEQVDLSQWQIYSIGPITTKAVEASNEQVFKQAEVYDMAHLYQEVMKEIE